MKKLSSFLIFIFIILSSLNFSIAIEPDVFVQSTVNRASQLLSENISKEEKIENLNFTYRRGFQKKDTIILYGKFKKVSGDKTKIKKQMELYEQKRNDTQPQRVNCCGSIFKNPPNQNAWKLIKTSLDESFYEGPVRLSKKHSNFFENDPNISADKVIKFIETIKSKVNQKYQIILDQELIIVWASKN